MDLSDRLNFAAGQMVTWKNNHIGVQRELGSGLTSSVFKGVYKERPVAIKTLSEKYARAENIRQAFKHEYEYLLELWDKWGKRYPDQPQVTPEYISGDMEAIPPFFMMELIDGVPIDDNLAPGQPIENELDVIAVMRQFGRLLNVLHLDLNKTYADIKFTNLWLLNRKDGQGQPLLKVIDWNVLGEVNPETVARDLFFASLYFYRLATGIMPPYRNGRVQIRLDNNETFHKLTAGSRAFILKALHPNPLARFASAQEWTNAIQQLYDTWTLTANTVEFNAKNEVNLGDEITCQARDFIEQARQATDLSSSQALFQKAAETFNQANQHYTAASNLLDMAQRKGRGNTLLFRDLSERVSDGLQKTSYLERGRVALLGASYKEAMQEYNMGAQVSLFESEPLRRWYWLASAASDLGITEFEKIRWQALDGVEALIKKEFLLANDRLQEACDTVGEARLPVGLQALRNEVKIYLLARSAQEKSDENNFPEALADYQEAQALARNLPKEPPTRWAEELGDLSTLAQRAQHEYETSYKLNESLSNAEELLNVQDWEAAGNALFAAAVAVPDDHRPGAAWVKAIEDRLAAGDLNTAYRLAEQALSAPSVRDQVRQQWQIIAALRELENIVQMPKGSQPSEAKDNTAVEQSGEESITLRASLTSHVTALPEPDSKKPTSAGVILQLFLDQASNYQTRYASNPYALGKSYTRIISNAVQRALTEQELHYASQIIFLLHALNIDSAEHAEMESDLNRHVDLYRQRLLKDLKEELTNRLSEAQVYRTFSLFQKAENQAKLAEKQLQLAPEHLDEAWQALLDETHRAYQTACREAEQTRQANQEKVNEISQEELKLEKEWQIYSNELNKLPTDRHPKIRQAYEDLCIDLSARRLALLLEWQLLDPANAAVQEKIDHFSDSVDKIGFRGWAELVKAASVPLEQINQFLRQVRNAYRNGDLPTARVILDRLQPYRRTLDEVPLLESEIQSAAEFIAWYRKTEQQNVSQPSGPSENDDPEKNLKELQPWFDKQLPQAYWQESNLQAMYKDRAKNFYDVWSRSKNRSKEIKQFVRCINALQCTRRVDRAAGVQPTSPSLKFNDIFSILLSKKIPSFAEFEATMQKVPLGMVQTSDVEGFLKEREQTQRNHVYLLLKRTALTIGGVILLAIITGGILFLRPLVIPPPTATASPTLTIKPPATVALEVTEVMATPAKSAATEAPIATTAIPSPTPPSSTALTAEERAAFLTKYPDFPPNLLELYIMDSAQASYLPNALSWQDDTNADKPGPMKFLDSNDLKALEGQPVQARWTFSLKDPGYYAVWFEDTRKESSTDKVLLTYQVVSTQHGPLVPAFGVNQAPQLQGSKYSPNNPFVNVGIYHLEAGESIDIVLDVDARKLSGQYVGVDRVIVGRLPMLNGDGIWNQHPDLKGRTIVFWVDNLAQPPEACKPADKWVDLTIPPEQAVAYWDGNARQIPIAADDPVTARTASFTWSFPFVQGPGNIQVAVLVPPALEIPVIYEVYLDKDTKPLVRKQLQDPAASGVRGTILGLFDVPFELPAGAHTLRVVVKVYTDAEKKDGLLVADAVMILLPK